MSSLHRNRFDFHSNHADADRAADPAPAASWPAWTDTTRYTAPDLADLTFEVFEPETDDAQWVAAHLGLPDGTPPGEPRLPFADWIRVKASLVRLDGTPAAKWLAGEIDQLADLAEHLEATTPDEFDGRYEVMESSRAEDLVYAGVTRGYEQGKEETLELFGRG